MPHAPDLSGTALDDRYELHAVIGEGAFGRVYRGRDRRLARPVAVKVIKPWWTEDPEWVATFEREAQLLASVSDPGIVQIFDVGQSPQGLFYVSELVQGENLADRLRRGPLAPWDACVVATQLCRALAHAHERRIVHRDVKPANILISDEGRVKVGDFGVARLAEGSTDASMIVGTPKYMAPEQGRGRPTSPATDVYSVGVVMYEMLAGRPPFTGSSVVELALNHLQDEPPALPSRLPASLVAITERALAKDPQARYADGGEMARALVGARRESDDRRRRAAAPPRTRTPAHAPRRAPVAAGAVTERESAPEAPTVLGAGDGARGPGRARSRRGTARARRGSGSGAPPEGPDRTRIAPELSPRRTANPAARRRAAAALTVALALLGAMVAATVVLGSPARTHVPAVVALSQHDAVLAADHADVKISFERRYDASRPGTIISQQPGPGTRVDKGSRILAVLSRGPAPVALPRVVEERVADARQSLGSLGLRTSVVLVAAPGTAPGTVTGQRPAGGSSVPAGSLVRLTVAEVPQWHQVTSFQSEDSGGFPIRGEHWRVQYNMNFQGTCTWIFWCSGPHAQVINTATGQTVATFGLSDGGPQSRGFTGGPGSYEIRVTPGGDDAAWSIQVQDDY